MWVDLSSAKGGFGPRPILWPGFDKLRRNRQPLVVLGNQYFNLNSAVAAVGSRHRSIPATGCRNSVVTQKVICAAVGICWWQPPKRCGGGWTAGF